jgi:diguanylate cyclase (GGDEF)-like protein
MIRELAEGTSNPPEWVLPVFYQNRPIGLVTVDQFEEPQDEQHLQLAGDMVEEFWQHVYQADHLRIAHLKDRASGVLNRVEFMCLLDDMVQRSYEAYEPVVIMVICLEGLRGLDDEGQWEKRDGVIESVGQVICAGVRKDDIVGRFSDSVFVAVLRRLDTSLAELICKKLMVQVQQSIANREAEPFVTLRAGLAGSGLEQVPAEELMLQAFSALQSARQEQKTLKTVTAKKDTPEESS